MPEQSTQTSVKQIVRFLKLLRKGADASSCSAAATRLWVLEWQGRKHSFPNNLIEECLGQAFVVTSGATIRLTDKGTVYLMQKLYPDIGGGALHGCIREKAVMVDSKAAIVMTNDNESPLMRLYTRRDKSGKAWLNSLEFEAGERLRRDFEKSQLQPRISANWIASVATGGRGGNHSAEISDFAMDARKRVDRAILAMGQDLSGIALDICCFLKGLETVERERSWPPRSAKLMLRTALRELVQHYGMASQPNNAAIKQWGSADYRPSL